MRTLNTNQMPTDQNRLKAAIFAALEGSGRVYEELGKVSRGSDHGQFAFWLRNESPIEGVSSPTREYLLHLARQATLEWCYELQFHKRLPDLMGRRKPSVDDDRSLAIPNGALERCARIGQWPQTLSDRRVQPDQHGRGALEWCYTWLKDHEGVAAFCAASSSALPNIKEENKLEAFGGLKMAWGEIGAALLPNQAALPHFLRNLAAVFRSKEGIYELRAEMENLAEADQQSLAQLGYRAAAYFLGLKGILPVGTFTERSKDSWLNGVLRRFSLMLKMPKGRCISADWLKGPDGVTVPVFIGRAYLEGCASQKVRIVPEDDTFSLGRKIEHDLLSLFQPTYEDGVDILKGKQGWNMDLSGIDLAWI